MNFERLKELLDKIPTMLLLVGYLGYLAFDFYTFTNDDSSALLVKRKQVEGSKEVYTKLEKKLKELNEFVKSLDVKKAELRKYASELQEVKGGIPEVFDVSKFMEMTFTEAKKAGMKVESLIPGPTTDKEYYSEHRFTLNSKGLFPQILTFLERMANVTEIVRVDSFRLVPVGESGKYSELRSELDIKTYQYLGSKADSVAKRDPGEGGAPAGAPVDKKPGEGRSPPGVTK